MSEVKWIKVSTGIFDNRKIKQIEAMPKGDTILIIWFKLLCLAGVINDGGAVYITPELPYTVKGLAAELGRPQAVVQKALDTFKDYGMISISDGFISFNSWSKYQNIDGMEKIKEQTKKRVAKHREKKKKDAVTDNGEESACNASCNVTVTQCNETEEEIEEEGEEEREYHSFILSKDKNPDFSESVTCNAAKADCQRRLLYGHLGQGVVLLSDEQFDDLCDRLSVEELDKYIGIVADCELNGKPFRRKTHYQAIIDMAEKDRMVKV